MSLIDILIIAACLGVGYWIVNSVIGDKKEPPPKEAPREPVASAPEFRPAPPDRKALPDPRPARASGMDVDSWHIVLDIPKDSSARDIQAAMKRRISQANASGDTAAAELVRRAGDYALKQKQTP